MYTPFSLYFTPNAIPNKHTHKDSILSAMLYDYYDYYVQILSFKWQIHSPVSLSCIVQSAFYCYNFRMHNFKNAQHSRQYCANRCILFIPRRTPPSRRFWCIMKLIFAEMSERSLCFWWNERMRMRIFIVNAKIHALCVQMPSCGWFRMWMCVKEFQNLFRNKLAIISLSL